MVVGGSAVHHHDPDLEPGDLDLVVEPSIENARRVAAALRSVGRPLADEDAIERLGERRESLCQINLKNDREFYADILSEPGGGFDAQWAAATEATIGYSIVKVASIPTLLERLARMADPKHAEDIERLKRVQRASG
jgi:hypothetical protein